MNPKNTAHLIKHFSFFGENFQFECEDGWFYLIKSLSENLQALNALNLSVFQVKEKFGGLRFYVDVSSLNKKIKSKIDLLIAEAEEASYSICEICGGVGNINTRNALVYMTRCTKCL